MPLLLFPASRPSLPKNPLQRRFQDWFCCVSVSEIGLRKTMRRKFFGERKKKSVKTEKPKKIKQHASGAQVLTCDNPWCTFSLKITVNRLNSQLETVKTQESCSAERRARQQILLDVHHRKCANHFEQGNQTDKSPSQLDIALNS